MSPPAFCDIGKEARDVLNNNYCLGVVKLDVKTKTPLNVKLNVNGVSNNDTGKVTAFLEGQYDHKEYGVTLKERWTADNTSFTEVTFSDPFVKGSKVGFSGFLAPQSGRKNGAIKLGYKNDLLQLKSELKCDHDSNNVVSSAVLGHQGFLAGVLLDYNQTSNRLINTNLAAGYQTNAFVVAANLVNANDITGSIYHRINPKLETGLTVNWKHEANTTKFNLGAVYNLDCCSSVRAKVNNCSQISLGFTHKLRQGVKLTLSALIEGQSLNKGGHKLGLGFNFEA